MFSNVKSAFLSHPRAAGETYVQHMMFALRFAGYLSLAALAALIHAVFPFLFESTASAMIARIHGRLHGRSWGDGPRTDGTGP